MQQLVVWVKSEEVDRNVRSQIIIQPRTELPSFAQVISYLRNNEVCYLCMNPGFIPDVQEGLKDRLRVRDHYMLPQEPGLRVPLEIYSYTIQKIVHHTHRIRGIIPIRDEDIHQTRLPCFDPNVPSVFDEDGWLIVSIRKSLTVMGQGHFYHPGRLDIDTLGLPSLTNLGILAIVARP